MDQFGVNFILVRQPWVAEHCGDERERTGALPGWKGLTRCCEQDTAGQILEYQGKPADAMYFSTSNGHTYSSADVFGGSPLPYLKAVPESDDSASPTSSWSVRMPLSDLAETLRLAGSWDGRPIDSVALLGDQVTVTGSGRSVTLPLGTFRNKLNVHAVCLQPQRYPTPTASGGKLPQVVPSTWMTLRQDGTAVVMTGRGWGHGVGMVQWGARGKADRGLGYRDILAYYYGGLRPVKVAEPGSIRVLLATGVQQVTVAPAGPVRVDGAPSGGGPVTITGGPAMTIASAAKASIAPTLSLSAVTVTATAMPGSPAAFSYTLSHAANVGLTYQQAGDPSARGTVPAVPVATGAQTLSWDPFAAGLPEGTYEAALVADDGVSRVVSSSFQISVRRPPPPSPTPSPSHTAGAAKKGSGPSRSGLPGWWPLALAAGLLALLAGGFAAVLLTRRAR